MVEDYVLSYVRHGFDTIVLASSHGGNFAALEQIVADEANKYPDVKIVGGYAIADLTVALSRLEVEEGLEPGVCGGHACDFETSAMLYVKPEYVHMEAAQRGFVGQVNMEMVSNMFKQGIRAVSDIGVMGDPTHADAERGARYFKAEQELLERVVP